MNKSLIEWCDRSWNPLTGCRHNCSYCYAAKQARRFCGDIRLNKASPQLRHLSNGLYELDKPFKNMNGRTIPLPVGFEPTFHKYRLCNPAEITKKSVNIFVGSMADVFGEWVPDEWIEQIFDACTAAPQHQYLFLTKSPQRYINLANAGKLPKKSNFWYGTTSTTPDSPVFWSDDYNTFCSIEPIMSDFSGKRVYDNEFVRWVIVGAETGNRKGKVVPERKWIEEIQKECERCQIPLFMKNNLSEVWGNNLIQEYPDALQPRSAPRPMHRVHVKSVRDKKYCNECKEPLQGQPAVRLGARRYECILCFERLEAKSWQKSQRKKTEDAMHE